MSCRKSLLICLAVVTFCFVGIEPAKACGDWDLVDCYMDGNGSLWLCWWNWDNWCLRWYCIEELFVHHSEIDTTGYRTLGEDEKVDLEIGQGKKGPCATNVVPG